MMHSVFLKTLYDKRWFILGWSAGLVALAVLLTTFYPAMRQDGSLDALVASMPKAFEGLIGNLADLKDFSSYIASQLFDIRLPLIAGIMAIILGLGLSSSEEESGELRTIVAQPVSRSKILFEKWLALVVISFIATLGIALGVYTVLPFIEDASIETAVMLRLLGLSWLVMVVFGMVPFAAGMAFGKRSIATGIGVFVVIGSFILSTFGSAVEWLEPFEKFSLLHYFPAVDVAKNDFDIANIVVLGAVGAIAYIIAWLVFRRRDIA